MSKPPQPIPTYAALGRALDITRQSAHALARSDAWPFGPPPWDGAMLPQIRRHHRARRGQNNYAEAVDADAAWRKANTGTPADADTDRTLDAGLDAIKGLSPLNKAKLKLTLERAASVRFDRELKAGGFLRAADVERDRVARVYAMRARLRDRTLRAHELAHKDEKEVAAILERWAKEDCDYFAGGGE